MPKSKSELDEIYNRIITLRDNFAIKLEQYNTAQIHITTTIENTATGLSQNAKYINKNATVNGKIGFVTSTGYFRPYKYDNDSDVTTISDVFGEGCPAEKTGLPEYKYTDNSDTLEYKDENGDIVSTIKYSNNEIKQGQNCKLDYGGNLFVYNVDESQYSSYEGCKKLSTDTGAETDNLGTLHSGVTNGEDCLEKTANEGHNYFTLGSNNNIVECRTYPTEPASSELVAKTNEDEDPKSEITIDLFDNREGYFDNTSNLFKKGYKSNIFGSFSSPTKTSVETYATNSKHNFFKLFRDGNLKIHKIGKTGTSTLKDKSVVFFDAHSGTITDSDHSILKPIEDTENDYKCHPDLGGNIDEDSIIVNWAEKCKNAGCYVYQDTGCAN